MTDVDWSKMTMPCPACGQPMVVRQNKSNGSRFMGCTGWPTGCSATAPIPASVIARAQGAAELPGFESP